MYTADRTTNLLADQAVAPGNLGAALAPKVATAFGLAAGVAILIDACVDAAGIEAVGPNLFGLLTPLLGLLLLPALYIAATRLRAGRLLDVGFLLNTLGLALVVAIDFSRIFVLGELAEPTREGLLNGGPTAPALFAAASVYIVGTVLFGAALITRRFATRSAWIYTLTAVPSGLVVILPDVVGAVAQALAGVAIIGLAIELRRSASAQRRGAAVVSDEAGVL